MTSFFDGFEKTALQDTYAKEMALQAGSSYSPLIGTTLHTSLADRPKDHSRLGEWGKRMGGAMVGGAIGTGIGALILRKRGLSPKTLGLAGNLSTGGGLIGGTVGGHHSIKKYYDKDGNLKKEYKKNKN